MPISDYIVSLALAFHPHADAKLPLNLGADAVGQPAGGAPARLVPGNGKWAGAAAAPAHKTCPKNRTLTRVKTSSGIVVDRCELKTRSKVQEGYVTPGRKY